VLTVRRSNRLKCTFCGTEADGRAEQVSVAGAADVPQNLRADDIDGYAAVESVVSFLLEKGGTVKFLNFVEAGVRNGWDRAIQTFYREATGASDVAELQRKCQAQINAD